MNYTDKQLQLALAKMLPEKIGIFEQYFLLYWKDGDRSPINREWLHIKETEWLHVCWLVGLAMNANEQYEYMLAEKSISNDWAWKLSWQQRTIVIAQVKGVEI